MIYVCTTTRDNATTVGLLLWKVRQVFGSFPREYHLLVIDDASTDATVDVLEPYQRALPLTLYRNDKPRGRSACLERLVEVALGRSDRPKRDCMISLPADFAISPEWIPELVRKVESGADVVIGEVTADRGPLGTRLVRAWAPWLLRPGLTIPGIKDIVSGFAAIRLISLKKCHRGGNGRLLVTDGVSALPELVARAAAGARQIAAVPIERRSSPDRSRDDGPFRQALELFAAGRKLDIPAPSAELQRAS